MTAHSEHHADAAPATKAHLLRRLHHGGEILLLPNAWDAASARLLEASGFPAVATSSAGVAAAQGYPDGAIPPGEMLAAVARIARAVDVPVSADVEDAYVAAADLDRFVEELIATGAVGLNIEDVAHETGALRTRDEQAARIGAIRSAAHRFGVPLVINARTDIFLRGIGEPRERERLTIERLHAYRDAGADCLFVPGVTEAALIGRLAAAARGPLNVLAVAASPDLATLKALGVARVSLGSGPMRVALTSLRELCADLRESGRFDRLGPAIPYAEVNTLMRRREAK